LLGEIKQRVPDLPVMMVTAYCDDEHPRLPKMGAAEFNLASRWTTKWFSHGLHPSEPFRSATAKSRLWVMMRHPVCRS
jgi:hypothetical protein